MVDYTLSEGDDILIREDTIVENFHYRGGKLRITPASTFNVGGNFYFEPTSSEDALDKILGTFETRMVIESGKNALFSGFQLYDMYPENKPLFFPCIIVDRAETAEEVGFFFGGVPVYNIMITCDLAFKGDKYINISSSNISKTELAEHYLYLTRKKLGEIIYNSNNIKVGDVIFKESIEKPTESTQTLYGFAIDIDINYVLSE